MNIVVGDKITYGRTNGKKFTAIVVKLNKMSFKVIRKEGEFLIHEYVTPALIINADRECVEQEVKPSLVSRLQKENEILKKENERLKSLMESLNVSR